MSYLLYIELINGLKMCVKHKIKFSRVYKLIRDITNEPDKTTELQNTLLIPYKNKNVIDDELQVFICELVEEIIRVQNFMFYELNETFSKLHLLNEILEKCGEAPRETITQAKKVFSQLYVNIYDVLANYYNYVSCVTFMVDIHENPDRKAPLHIVKSRYPDSDEFKYPHLKCFLKNIVCLSKVDKFVNTHLYIQKSLKPVNTHIRFP